MSEYGLKVWDAAGGLLFSGADETMRIVATVQVRIGGAKGVHTVGVAAARLGMYALVQCITPYTEWQTRTAYKTGVRNSVPSVRVLDGAIQLYGPASSSWNGNIDVILVAT